MTAYVFPGQGAQFVTMGQDLYNTNAQARELFEQANAILGFRITDLMFGGTEEDLQQTRVTQPAVFLHSVISALVSTDTPVPDAVAGHSLGEFSALVVAGAIRFEDGLRLVAARAEAMQRACEQQPGTMAAVTNLSDATIAEVCSRISRPDYVVQPANYNCPGQVVISGCSEAIAEACVALKAAGARRALPLPVGGAFHSPLMEPARLELKQAIEQTEFMTPRCPVYQNVDALPHTCPEEIRHNLLLQLTAPVRWTDEVNRMLDDGITSFLEFGPGQVLTGLIGKITAKRGLS